MRCGIDWVPAAMMRRGLDWVPAAMMRCGIDCIPAVIMRSCDNADASTKWVRFVDFWWDGADAFYKADPLCGFQLG